MQSKNNLIIAVFGGTGDLMTRKLMPAFLNLWKKRILGEGSFIIGIGRKEFDDLSYKKFLSEGGNEEYKGLVNMLPVKYYKTEISKEGALSKFSDYLNKISEKSNKIFYLATSYEFFPKISEMIALAGLNKDSKIVFEKPFGNDLKSFLEIEDEIHKIFLEEQIYRIDHYLAKETVQNIMALRYFNTFFDKILNKEMIESIEVTADEDIGVGNRIAYYNKTGAIKDMIQSHLLQILALLLMELPKELNSDEIHDEKVKVLKSVEVIDNKENLLGQYETYKKEAFELGINETKTETFAKIILNCKNERWNGVKLILRTGKKLERKYGQIKINFKRENKKVQENAIVIDIFPKQDIVLHINSLNPLNKKVEKAKFEFSKEKNFGPNSIDEYAVLLEEIIAGEKTLFARADEVEESWKIIEKIEAIKNKIKFVVYPDGREPD